MTGNVSPIGQVLGATTTGTVSAGVLANTGNPIFQSILIGAIVVSAALLLTRIVKTAVK